jgi:hypothetical protein
MYLSKLQLELEMNRANDVFYLLSIKRWKELCKQALHYQIILIRDIRDQRYGDFVIAQSTEHFIFERATSCGKYSKLGSAIDVRVTLHSCATKSNT